MKRFVLRAHGETMDLGTTRIMGVINMNEDSFYAGSRVQGVQAIMGRAQQMVTDGADILDLGVMSSRPGAHLISPENEWNTLKEILPEILNLGVWVSIDTIYSSTAARALDRGSHIINDISGGRLSPDMIPTVAQYPVPFIPMHSRGTPETMASLNQYPAGTVFEVLKEMKSTLNQCQKSGIQDLIVDPGFGFAKNPQQNFEMLRSLSAFHVLGKPLLVGISRKSMIWRTLSISPEEALNGTTALHAYALTHHPHILRVHDVKEVAETIKLFQNLNPEGESLA